MKEEDGDGLEVFYDPEKAFYYKNIIIKASMKSFHNVIIYINFEGVLITYQRLSMSIKEEDGDTLIVRSRCQSSTICIPPYGVHLRIVTHIFLVLIVCLEVSLHFLKVAPHVVKNLLYYSPSMNLYVTLI